MPGNEYHFMSFYNAVESDNKRHVIMALSSGVDINTIFGKTALSIAVEQGNLSMAKVLLKNGSNPSISSYCELNSTFETPITLAARLQNMPMLELLLEHRSFQTDEDCREGG